MNREWYYTVNRQQQGPVSEVELKQMVAARSLEPGALVWTEGMVEWTAFESVPELQGGGAPMGGAVPQAMIPPAAGTTVPGVAPNPLATGGGAHPYRAPGASLQGNGYLYPAPPKQGMAVASLVCSILGIFGCCFGLPLSITGVVLGHVQMGKVKNHPTEYSGGGMALAGVIIGYIAIVMGVGMVVLGAFEEPTTTEEWEVEPVRYESTE